MLPKTFNTAWTVGLVTLGLVGFGYAVASRADVSGASADGAASATEASPSGAPGATAAAGGTGHEVRLATAAEHGLPTPGMVIDPERTAIVVTDPQNDFLSPKGVAWGVVGESVTENRTVENIGALFEAAKRFDVPVFVSPHYYYPHDHGWKFEGALERLMHDIKMFDRKDPLSLKGFEGSGADWLEQYKSYIEAERTIVTSPHKVYGPDTNDLVLQLRKQGIDKVILAGMSANLCTESHMRELLEQGFEVTVAQDATAAAKVPAGDGYQAALTNFRYMASAVVTTEEAVRALGEAFGDRAVARK